MMHYQCLDHAFDHHDRHEHRHVPVLSFLLVLALASLLVVLLLRLFLQKNLVLLDRHWDRSPDLENHLDLNGSLVHSLALL
jgi:hypothetical protein